MRIHQYVSIVLKMTLLLLFIENVVLAQEEGLWLVFEYSIITLMNTVTDASLMPTAFNILEKYGLILSLLY